MADQECCTGGKETTETGSKSKCCTPQQACCDGCNCTCCQAKERDGPAECKCESGNCKCCAGCKSK
ncbi:hypothetical protein Bhyg_05013 [Pseudolycoriella hygida]|uniref:Metallothionein n=1 Tax=Pseudolycoriella hygida TaxID=35572 RepID=A0A9Q0NGE2_9DIPT|nr:hypothetical protein Bhyg_05013 [Pseudolycoriella hygida]